PWPYREISFLPRLVPPDLPFFRKTDVFSGRVTAPPASRGHPPDRVTHFLTTNSTHLAFPSPRFPNRSETQAAVFVGPTGATSRATATRSEAAPLWGSSSDLDGAAVGPGAGTAAYAWKGGLRRSEAGWSGWQNRTRAAARAEVSGQ